MANDGPSEDELRAELASRPRIDEALAAQDRMLTEIRDAIDAAIGGRQWQREERNGGTSGCQDFPGFGGVQKASDRWVLEGGVTDEEWGGVEKAVTTVTGQHGFAAPSVIRDQPGGHTLMISRADGAVVDLGSSVNLVLSARTGCHPSS